jgi:cell division topological specificity factor
MIEFLNRLFGRQTSGATAKERLRLVLMSDHLSLAPEMIESMKHDLIDVVSRYVEVDREKIDVHFENQENALAMLANIPITGVNRTPASPTNGNGKAQIAAEPPAAAPKPRSGQGRSRRRRKKAGETQPQSSSAPAAAT